MNFTHLHVHSHYSMLDGMSKVSELVSRAKELGMHSIALTDHGNMFGIKDLIDTVAKVNSNIQEKIKEVEGQIKELEKKRNEELGEQREVEQEEGHTPQSLRAVDSTRSSTFGSPNLGEQLEELQEQLAKLKGQLFKPIIGTEAYCARRTLYDKDKDVKEINPETGKERIVDSSGYHLIDRDRKRGSARMPRPGESVWWIAVATTSSCWPRTCKAITRSASWPPSPTPTATTVARVSTTTCWNSTTKDSSSAPPAWAARYHNSS